MDIALIVESITYEFGKVFWKYIKEAEYSHINKSTQNAQFYRFTSPKSNEYPFMIEIFSRNPDYIILEDDAYLTPLPIEHVDSKNIKKHKNDVFRLAQVIALDTRQMVSAEILEDMKQFLGLVENDNVDLKTIGIKEISYKTMIELLYRCYFTKD